MPELPEVESVRRMLADRLTGRSVASVTVRRSDVVRGQADGAALLAGAAVTGIARQGKQLALSGRRAAGHEPVVCVHLGMTGQLVWQSRGQLVTWARGQVTQQEATGGGVEPLGADLDPHTHLLWHFDDGSVLRFRDVRRFGGLWPFASSAELASQRWDKLGTDALTIQPRRLHRALRGTRRALKTALLDQNLVAGLGNIYVDELLFTAGLAPQRPADTLSLATVQRLVRQMRRLLHQAIDAGGSTFRDYVNASGEPGGFQSRHRMYGRAGLACRRCREPLAAALVGGRSTVFCPRCQQ
jgi:formamidopyrimidine-DNA glycosylase